VAVADLDGDGRQEVVVGVGKPGGTEGRWSLAEGSAMRLYVMKPLREGDMREGDRSFRCFGAFGAGIPEALRHSRFRPKK
jgi:hypothetical protein